MFEGLLSFLRDRGWIEDAVMERYSSEREAFQIHDDDIKQAGRRFILDNYATWSKQVADCPTPLSPGRAYGFWIKLSKSARDGHEAGL